MKLTNLSIAFLIVVLTSCATAVQAGFIEYVLVGDPDNAADTRPTSLGYGAVAKSFAMGKFEITAGQYTEFLNAVAKTDAFGLYNTHMGNTADTDKGCNIQRSGNPDDYSYSVEVDWADRPVNYISWGDAARFCNWLENGITEDGSYTLNGKTSVQDLIKVKRNDDAHYVIPTENEWYKAAYYDPNRNGTGSGGYWTYPTKNESPPSNVLDASGDNNANFYISDFTIGGPEYRTKAGAFESSPSAYGTYDQGGNVWELTETLGTNSYVERGGSFDSPSGDLDASSLRIFNSPLGEFFDFGFRVAIVPEPSGVAMLLMGTLAAMIWRRRKNNS